MSAFASHFMCKICRPLHYVQSCTTKFTTGSQGGVVVRHKTRGCDTWSSLLCVYYSTRHCQSTHATIVNDSCSKHASQSVSVAGSPLGKPHVSELDRDGVMNEFKMRTMCLLGICFRTHPREQQPSAERLCNNCCATR